MDDRPDDELSQWWAEAAGARRRGDFLEAAILYAKAASKASTVKERLHSMMREAFCQIAMEHHDAAESLALAVANEARTEGHWAELADALGILVDRRMVSGRLAEASELLAEAMYVMERVPDDPAHYQVIHNTADTYQRCNFPLPALGLFDRALRLAQNESDRTFAHANMAACYHMAMNYESDPVAAEAHAHNGIYAATAALDPHAASEVIARAIALAHRSVLFNAVGNHRAGLDDARAARMLTEQHGLREELAVAMVGESVARWKLDHDPTVLETIFVASLLAQELGIEIFLISAASVTVDILWEAGRYDEARTAMTYHQEGLRRALGQERAARWEYVRLGVSHKSTEAISESDPLTGLPNRRYLGKFLPDTLEAHGPVCVGVLDLDGFKQVNDEYSYAHGDRVLQELSGILQRICRRGDAVVRLGGDEFVIVLRETSPRDARMVLERVCETISARVWDGLPATVRLSASVGVAVGSGAIDAPRVLATASEALRRAKREGRNRIIFR